MPALTLLTVHAHPDDEASKGASVCALYAARGVRTVLVTCTDGAEGEVLNPSLDAAEILPRIREIRAAELAAAAKVIGFDATYLLGYRDSGMADSEANTHPDSFVRADLEEATGKLVEIVRRERPQVVVTYEEDGGYPHPDHIRTHEIGIAAFDAAGDPDAFPEAGPPHRPLKLYYSAWSRRRLAALHEAMLAAGLESPYTEWLEREDRDHRLTTQIDVGSFLHIRREALLAHRTQVDPDGWWFKIPDETVQAVYPFEDYILAKSHVDVTLPETDLFAGIGESSLGGEAARGE